MNKKVKRIIWIGLAFWAVLMVLLPNKAQLQNQSHLYEDLPPLNDYPKEGHSKMEFVVYELMKTYLIQGIEEARDFARQRLIDMEGDFVRVVLEIQADRVSEEEIDMKASLVKKQVESCGGKVETSYRQLVQSVVPLGALLDMADFPLVRYVRLPMKPIPLVVSEGVNKTGANQWHNIEPYRTQQEAKVCILDLGFKGYQNLLGNELPSTVTTRSFRANGSLTANEKHGTACAEIVYDMAPNARLWLVNFATDVEHRNAVTWIINQGVDVISYSIGWFNAGAGNGTGPVCEDVKRAHDNGIIWAGAAGNEAENHWEGTFNDPDGDKWNNFSGVDEVLSFWVPSYTLVGAYLNWNDWGSWNDAEYSGSNQDYDLYLYIRLGNNLYQVAKSQNRQTGWQWPVESIGYWYSNVSAYWGIAIRKYSASKNVKFEAFISGNSSPVQYNIPAGSLLVPGDSSHSLTIGATDWSNDSYHSYSSRGPTHDGRVKPDLAAPSGVSCFTYGERAFYGTSAATPHVAGAFALLYGKAPYTLEQIRTILEARAVDLGPSGKDNQYGSGRLNLLK
jgi:subtilisin family serine protease